MFETHAPQPYLTDRAQVVVASELIVSHGVFAVAEAATRAARSRDVGNHVQFCRWRQIKRLIELLVSGRATGTIH